MDSLPDAIVQCILSHMSNARDVAVCNCVSKRWKDSTPYIRSLYFPRNSFDNHSGGLSPDNIIWRIISSIVHLEELVVYSPFTGAGLSSWLSSVGPSLRHLELRMDNLVDLQACQESPSKLECLKSAANLETLKLWGVLMTHSPRWDVFQKLKNLEIVGAKFEDPALNTALHACPNLSNLLLLACEGLSSVSIELKHLEQCKLDFYGLGNCSLLINAPKLQLLEVQGCSWIRARGTSSLRNLSIANNHGRVYMVDFDKLVSLETLSLRGIQWVATPSFFLLLLLLHLSSKFDFARSDPDPLQDFCVADQKASTSSFFNGIPCINPNLATVDHFKTSALSLPGNTKSNRFGFSVTLTNPQNLPGINTLGLTLARIDLDPRGLVPLHSHPRASEVTICLIGQMVVGFVDTSNRVFTKKIGPGESFVFPKGLLHFMYNEDFKKSAVAVSGLNSQNPGAQLSALAAFTSKPEIPQEVLKKSFQISECEIAHIRKSLGG